MKSSELGIAESPAVDIHIPAFDDIEEEPSTLAELMGEVQEDKNMDLMEEGKDTST